jgi:hypothetical protein
MRLCPQRVGEDISEKLDYPRGCADARSERDQLISDQWAFEPSKESSADACFRASASEGGNRR